MIVQMYDLRISVSVLMQYEPRPRHLLRVTRLRPYETRVNAVDDNYFFGVPGN